MPNFKCTFVGQDQKTVIGEIEDIEAVSPEDAAVFYKKKSTAHQRTAGPFIGVFDDNWEPIQTFGVKSSTNVTAEQLESEKAQNEARRNLIRNTTAYSGFRNLIFAISLFFIFTGSITVVIGLSNFPSLPEEGFARLLTGVFFIVGSIVFRQFAEIIADIADMKIQAEAAKERK